jgi:sigma-B regulation protein RsbU (phosphoserine phosphatase)
MLNIRESGVDKIITCVSHRIGIAVIIVLGMLDYHAPPDISFLIFYLPPVLTVTWDAGLIPGLILSIISACFWFFDDVFGTGVFRNELILYWNVFSRFLVFILTVKLISSLKERMEKEKQAEQRQVAQEFEIARQVQLRLLPAFIPQMPGLRIAGICVPARQVGGDYYDFLPLSSTRLAMAIGDVSGKGLPSALIMAQLQGMVRSSVYSYADDPAGMVILLNRLLIESTDINRFVSFFYGVFDASSLTFTYVNAGHNPALVLRNEVNQKNQIFHLSTTGAVLGVNPDASYRVLSIGTKPGDSLVLYTDGIIEATNNIEEEYGESRLVQAITNNHVTNMNDLCHSILSDVVRFSDSVPQQDDMTLVVFRISDAAKAAA